MPHFELQVCRECLHYRPARYEAMYACRNVDILETEWILSHSRVVHYEYLSSLVPCANLSIQARQKPLAPAREHPYRGSWCVWIGLVPCWFVVFRGLLSGSNHRRWLTRPTLKRPIYKNRRAFLDHFELRTLCDLSTHRA